MSFKTFASVLIAAVFNAASVQASFDPLSFVAKSLQDTGCATCRATISYFNEHLTGPITISAAEWFFKTRGIHRYDLEA